VGGLTVLAVVSVTGARSGKAVRFPSVVRGMRRSGGTVWRWDCVAAVAAVAALGLRARAASRWLNLHV
jgi:hypothetical protein